MEKYWKILSVFCSILGVSIAFYSTKCQIELTYDSYDYLASAKSFAEKGILLTQNGEAHVIRTPLFSIVLSFFGNNVILISKFFHLFCLLISLNIFLKLGFQYISQPFLKITYALGITLGTPIYLIHHFLWSEALFLSLLAGLIIIFIEIIENLITQKKPSKFYVFFIILLGIFLTLQKNTGIIFLTGLLIITVSFPQLWKKLLSLYILSISLWIAWTIGTLWISSENIHPAISDFETSLWQRQNLLIYADVISRWFLPSIVPFTIRISIIAIFILGLSLFFLQKFKKEQITSSIWFIICFYLLVLQLTEKVAFEEVQRYVAVIFPLFMFTTFVFISKILNSFLSIYLKNILTFVLIVWIFYSGLRTYKNVRLWSERSCHTTPNTN